jgi:hypothetical protein
VTEVGEEVTACFKVFQNLVGQGKSLNQKELDSMHDLNQVPHECQSGTLACSVHFIFFITLH